MKKKYHPAWTFQSSNGSGLQESSAEQDSFVLEGMDILQKLTKALAKWKLEKLLSGPYDDRPAILNIQVSAPHVLFSRDLPDLCCVTHIGAS